MSCDKSMGFIMPESPPPYYPIADNVGVPIPPDPEADQIVNACTRIILHGAPKEAKERTLFLRKVYCVLAGMSIAISGTIALFLYLPSLYIKFDEMSGWKFWPLWLIALLVASCVTGFDQLMRQPPMNYYLVLIFTICSGLLLGSLSAYIQSEKILIDMGIIGIICICAMLFTFQRKLYITPFNSLLGVSLCLLAAFGFLCIAFTPWDSLYIVIAPTVFFAYLIFATHIMIKDKTLEVMSTEYVYAAVRICMFFVPNCKCTGGCCSRASRSNGNVTVHNSTIVIR